MSTDPASRLAEAAAHPVLATACLGRAWLPAAKSPVGIGGPVPAAIGRDGVFDLSGWAATAAAALNRPDLPELLSRPDLPRLSSTEEALVESHYLRRRSNRVHLLSPLDLQVIKAAGVTFSASLVERFIEGLAEGDPERAEAIRERLDELTSGRLHAVRPGTPEALRVLDELRAAGLSSPYLAVGLGKHAEIFTKAPLLSSVGFGERVGVRPDSSWNNPEPEVVLVMNSTGSIVGATLGNDVNLRDFEGWSPLLLGVAKDANGSCAIGPWLRLFDADFQLEDLLETEVSLTIEGESEDEGGFAFHGVNRLAEISRDPRDLVDQAAGRHHQYPDGFALFLGTMMIPTVDRAAAGLGFTHRRGDMVRIENSALGTLVNWVETTDRLDPWAHGVGWLMDNLARRGLLAPAA